MMFKKLLILLVFTASAIALYYFYIHQQKNQNDDLILYGNVDVRQVDLSFRVAGLVKDIYFEEGDFVQTGSLVGILDQQPYQDEVRQAEANVESIYASLNNANTLFKRRENLISDGSISQEDLDNALSNKIVLEANLKSAEATLAVALTNLYFTQAFAPTNGTILSRIREPGTVVKPSDPIYSLSITSPVWIRAFISEPYLGIVYPGMKAEIYTDMQNGPVFHGYVGFISPLAEFTPKSVETTQLRTDLVYRLRIYADNPEQGLRQGMPVTVKLINDRKETNKINQQEVK